MFKSYRYLNFLGHGLPLFISYSFGEPLPVIGSFLNGLKRVGGLVVGTDLSMLRRVSAFGLPLRASAGFFVEASMSSGNRSLVTNSCGRCWAAVVRTWAVCCFLVCLFEAFSPLYNIYEWFADQLIFGGMSDDL